MQCQTPELIEKVEELLDQKKKLEREITELKQASAKYAIGALVENPHVVENIRFVTAKVDAGNVDELKMMSDTIREKLRSGVGVLGAQVNGKVSFVCSVTDDLIKERGVKAGDIIKQVAAVAGGSGGGRPHMALAGGKDATKLEAALGKVPEILQELANRS